MSNVPPHSPDPLNPSNSNSEWATPGGANPYAPPNPAPNGGANSGAYPVANPSTNPADPYRTLPPQQGQPYQAQPYQSQPQQPFQAQPYQAAPQGYGQGAPQDYGQAPLITPPTNLGMAFPAMNKAKVEPFAVASVATFWTGIIGLILGIIGLKRTKQRGTRSPGLATVGISLSAFVTVAAVAIVTLFALNGTFARLAESPESGSISERTIASANLATGNCVVSLPPGSEVGDVRVVPCEAEHHAQVVSTQELAGEEYPGANEVARLAESACESSIDAVLTNFPDATIEPWYIVPSEDGWSKGETTAMCLVRSTTAPLNADYVN